MVYGCVFYKNEPKIPNGENTFSSFLVPYVPQWIGKKIMLFLILILIQEEQDMMKIMGFTGFNTTKNKKVANNDNSAVHMTSKRKYRQYMNRKGGFNRPLDAV